MTRTEVKPAIPAVKDLMAQEPDALREIVRSVMQTMLEAVSYSGVQRTVKRLGLRFKKTIYATEQDGPDVALASQLWRTGQSGRFCLTGLCR